MPQALPIQNKPRFFSIEKKIISIWIGLFLLGMIFLGWASYRSIHQAAVKNAKVILVHQLMELNYDLTEMIHSFNQFILVIATSSLYQRYFELPESRKNSYDDQGHILFSKKQWTIKNELDNWIINIQKKIPAVESCLIDKSGQEHSRVTKGIIAPPEEYSNSETQQPFFKSAWEIPPETIQLSPPYISPDTNDWVLAFVTPIQLKDGSRPAIFHNEIPLALLQTMANHYSEVDRNFPGASKTAVNQDEFEGLNLKTTFQIIAFDANQQVVIHSHAHSPISPNSKTKNSFPLLKEVTQNPALATKLAQTANENVQIIRMMFQGESTYLAFLRSTILDWTLVVIFQEEKLLLGGNTLRQLGTKIFTIALLIIAIGFLMARWLAHQISHPLVQISELANKLAKGNYNLTFNINLPKDEIGRLGASLESMKESLAQNTHNLEQQVRTRTKDLRLANEQLQHVIQELQTTREELVHSEKMASLGKLVAGFAHEVNTPIGIAVGTISSIPDNLNHIHTLLKDEEVDLNELEYHLKKIHDVSSLGMSNLKRASDLITRFKRTSIDQTYEKSRIFNIQEIIQDVLTPLNHRFKRTSINITLETPPCTIFSQPGVISQIITNLLINSLIHGFEDGKIPGQITLTSSLNPETKRFTLLYQDNGKGMEPETLKKAFDPFYTTNRSGGGSGLGLFICYNLIRDQLAGTIHCTSKPGEGVLFRINFPVNAEHMASDEDNVYVSEK
ncbi:MAG: ATP-binding protein [Magnetococcus sp. DMHC-6]